MNRLVARYRDGRVVKGTTTDFSTGEKIFHITPPVPLQGWERTEVCLDDLKALFYVKDYVGDPGHVEQKVLTSPPPAGERSVMVTFSDGEILVGTTPRYRAAGPGFFVYPADHTSNNEFVYAIDAATEDIYFM